MARNVYITLLIAALATACPAARLTLPTVFTDHMVLQQEKHVPVWGTAEPGTIITVEFANQKKTATADADGKWRTDLEPMKASAEPQIMTVSAGGQKTQIHDVLIGEVWLCSGQSNMQWQMERTENAAEAMAKANHPLIRLYLTPKVASDTPQDRVDAQWKLCTPDNIPPFSGVAYYFGKKLRQELQVPVGLIESAWGGTRIEPWTPPKGFEGIKSLASILEKIHPMPKLGDNPNADRQFPTALYNGMIHAHVPFAIRGVIWYQGEANRRDGMLYMDKTKALLNGWRELWGYNFPYYFVQIAPFQYNTEDPFFLPSLWEAQSEIVKQIPNTGMAVVSDHATLNNIHPPNKEIPGTRLALLALDNTYGKELISTGPTFKTMNINGSTVEITFDSAEGLTTRDGQSPDWFEICDEKGHFKTAHATISENRILLSSPDIKHPTGARFAWHKLATPNLINKAGLPTSAFCARKR